ncbi:hypothetical protein BLNAU_10182 [Blattamonas nauphoetae]|uniref:Uncharacterized protein n=1 Tax=Blattamonas nauphoetae TaxID=2049346 RepID=A0ABQ9XTQ2_9EUKA|nr:hypothetical protein BLNAU_10182 [Blattamonas nauphoetae]
MNFSLSPPIPTLTLNLPGTLDVSFNLLAIIPSSISQLTSLVKVNFGFNKIKEVPNELFRLPTLTHLIQTHKKLTSFPYDPAMSLKVELSLEIVDPLSNSMIYEKTGTGMHHGAVLCALERLSLASHRLTSVPLPVSQWKTNGTETARRGRLLLQTQEHEGFQERVDQDLKNRIRADPLGYTQI